MILPCPFCGNTPSEDDIQFLEGEKWGAVCCCIEGPEVRTGYKPIEHWRQAAIDAWNTRTPLENI